METDTLLLVPLAQMRSDTYVDFRECQLTLVNISRSWWLAQNASAHVATF